MANLAQSERVQRETLEALRQALAEGCPPPEFSSSAGPKSASIRAAEILGIPLSSLNRRVHHLRKRKVFEWPNGKDAIQNQPTTPEDDNEPASQIWLRNKKRNKRLAKAKKDAEWITINLPENLPVAVVFTADTHLDSPGCDLDLVERHREIVLATSGMYAVFAGDLLDNWPSGGRLARLNAKATITESQGRKMARWHLEQFGRKLLAVIWGNHDLFRGEDFRRLMEDRLHTLVAQDELRFKLRFPNGVEFKLVVRHGWVGNSQWNEAHAMAKAAKMLYVEADILMGGHLHTAAAQIVQNPDTKKITHCVQVSGYKMWDDFKVEKQYRSVDWMPAATAVLDPFEDNPAARVTMLPDVARAAGYLTYLRACYSTSGLEDELSSETPPEASKTSRGKRTRASRPGPDRTP